MKEESIPRGRTALIPNAQFLTKAKQKLFRQKTFLYSLTAGLRISVGGQLGVNEILAILDLSSSKKWKEVYKDVPASKFLSKCYLIFFLAQFVSDIVNSSSSHDFVRGWANIVVATIVTTFLIRLLWKSPDFIVAYLVGDILRAAFFGLDTEGLSLADMAFFKFRLVPILNDVLLLVSYYYLNKKYVNQNALYLLFIFYGLFCIAFDARSVGIFWVLTSILLIRRKKLNNISFKKLIPYILLFLLVFQGLYMLYVSEVLSGSFGGKHARDQIARVEDPYNPINLLITGRAETFVAMTAIGDSPIWGHGSWAPDKTGKYTALIYKLQGQEDRAEDVIKNTDYQLIIPSHSVLMGAWMTAGVIGFVAFLFIFIKVLKTGFELLKDRNAMNSRFSVIIIFYFFSFIWTCMFSPLPHIKEDLPIMIAVFFAIGQKVTLLAGRASNLQST